MILFRNSVFADITKVRIETRPYWIRVGPKANDRVLLRDRKDTEGKGHGKTGAGTGVM